MMTKFSVSALGMVLAFGLLATPTQGQQQQPQCLKQSTKCFPITTTGCFKLPLGLPPLKGDVQAGHDGFSPTLGAKCGKTIALNFDLCGYPMGDTICQGHGCDSPPGGGPPIVPIIADPLENHTSPFSGRAASRIAKEKRFTEVNKGTNPRATYWVDTVEQEQAGRPLLADAFAGINSYYLRATVSTSPGGETGVSASTGSIEVWQEGDHYRWTASTSQGVMDLDVANGINGYQHHQLGAYSVAGKDFRQITSPVVNPLYLMQIPLADEHDCLHPNSMTVCTMGELTEMARGEEPAEPRFMDDGEPVIEWFEKTVDGDHIVAAVRLTQFRDVGGVMIPHRIHFWDYNLKEDGSWDSEEWAAWATIEIDEVRLNEVFPAQTFVVDAPSDVRLYTLEDAPDLQGLVLE